MAASDSIAAPAASITPTSVLSPADVAAHAAASYVRPTPSRTAVRTDVCRETVTRLSVKAQLSPAESDLLASARAELGVAA